jgi:hypothetical protein
MDKTNILAIPREPDWVERIQISEAANGCFPLSHDRRYFYEDT